MTNTVTGPFIVSGASGQLGRQVAGHLLDAGIGPIVAVTRSPDKLADFAAKGVDIRTGDFNDPATLGAAFAGGGRLLIISTDDLERGKRLAAHRNAIDAAKAAGVAHIAYTSLVNPTEDNPITFTADHIETEALIEASGAGYTILRNSLYTDLLLMSAPQSIAMGKHFAAAADGKTGYVTRADCARAATSALMNETTSRVLNITGPEAISQGALAAILSGITGKDIPYVPISADEMVGAMTAKGIPEFMARFLVSFDEAMAAGCFDTVSDDLAELTGKPGQSARDFLTDNKAALLAPAQH